MTQLCLPAEMMDLTDSVITTPISVVKSYTMSGDLAQLADKQIADALEMDNATFSRFKQGGVGIKPEVMLTFFDKVGNELPLHYMAYRRGYYLQRRETLLERQLREQREANERLQEENRLLRDLHIGRR